MAFDPAGMVAALAMTEQTFARQHPDAGFTCSLPELIDAGKPFGLDEHIASGSYMGYKWSVSGCEGKPAGSFQIVAEPVAQGRGVKAACTDATQNLRESEDGRGSSCLSGGKPHTFQNESGDEGIGMVGVRVGVAPENKPRP